MKFGIVFLALLAGSGGWALVRQAGAAAGAPNNDPTARNRRLTALTGLVIYGLLAAISVTVIDVSGLLTEHYLVGLLILPPVLLKLGSTGYRLFRYYTGDRAYRLAGTPAAALRFVVAPGLVASTVLVFASGLELWLFGLRFGSEWVPVHTVSAVVMLIALSAHLGAHLRPSIIAAVTGPTIRRREPLSPRSVVAASLLLGAVLAVASLVYASPFSQSFGGG